MAALKTFEDEDDESTASENEEGGIEQQFTSHGFPCHEERKQLRPVKVIKVVQPNKIILKKIQDKSVVKKAFGGIEVDLGHQFYSWQTSTEQVKNNVDFKRKMHVIVHTQVTERRKSSSEDEEDDDELSKWRWLDDDDADTVADEMDAQFHRGVILHGVQDNSNGFAVFLYDIGVIKNVSTFEISPLKSDDFCVQELPTRFILMTIPGIVPRDTRLDTMKIPGMESCDRQAAEWNPEAVKDVEHWISKQKIVLFSELMPICEGCLFYGDLYGSDETGGKANEEPLSKYLTRKRNVFFEYKFLKQIYAKERDGVR